MGTLLQTFENDFLTAYKAGREVEVGVLRMLKTALKNRQVELGHEPDDDEALDIVGKQLKQRRESIEQFRSAGREDLAAKEEAEVEFLARYMPEPLTPAETEALVQATIAELSAQGMKDMGRVMGAITASHKGRVDGKALAALVRSKLAG